MSTFELWTGWDSVHIKTSSLKYWEWGNLITTNNLQSATNNPYKGRAADTNNMKKITITQSFSIKEGHGEFSVQPLQIDNKKGAYSSIKKLVDLLRAEACSLGLKATSKGLTDLQLSVQVDGEQTSIILGGRNKVALPDPNKYLKFLGMEALRLKDLQVDITSFNMMYDAILAMMTYHIVPFLTEEERAQVYVATGKEQFDANLNAKSDLKSAAIQQTAVAEQLLYKLQYAAAAATKENTTPFMDVLREANQRSFELHNAQKSEQRRLASAERKRLK